MEIQNIKVKKNLISFFLLIALFFPSSQILYSDSSRMEELQQKINQRNLEIEKIQKEIEKYETEIDKAVVKEKSLNNEITQLGATANKLHSEIKLTEQNINTTDFVIEKLRLEITEKNIQILEKKETMAEIIRTVDEEESKSLLEILLAHNNLSDFFDNLKRMEDLQKSVNFNLEDLKALKIDLENQQKAQESEKNKLEKLRVKLSDQKIIAESNKKQKDILLAQTKNQESIYHQLLTEQLKKQEALEKEIQEFEEQLRIEIDPDSLPPVGSGVLSWPLDKIIITQYFGNTPFATQNPQVYNGKGHNGVDFRASIGTPVKAAKSGTIVGVGDTDQQCRGVSYGKWVLIEHNNNLTTLYAHLSLIKAQPGQKIALGEIIGYSGTTGYVTGPHLHFGVYASQAVQIGTIKSRICGIDMRLPVASLNGYLNPLSYL